MNSMTTIGAAAGSVMALAAGAHAFPVQGVYQDLVGVCDDHGTQEIVEELGTSPFFPLDELISASSTPTSIPACPPSDSPSIPNSVLIITNLSGRSWTDLFYVADPETMISNPDGLATSFAAPGIATQAFRIDTLGVNRTLIAETMTPDGVFEPGETWEVLIQDYGNALGLPSSSLGSLDFAGASSGDSFSSGSIVALVPSPGTLGLAGLAGFGLARRRRA